MEEGGDIGEKTKHSIIAAMRKRQEDMRTRFPSPIAPILDWESGRRLRISDEVLFALLGEPPDDFHAPS